MEQRIGTFLEKLIFIVIGGIAGAISRFYLSNFVNLHQFFGLKIGTIAVNLIGSFAIGIVWGLIENRSFDPRLKLLITTGFLGCFTTFSTFSLETLQYFNAGEIGKAFANVAISTICGIALVFLGYFIAKYFTK